MPDESTSPAAPPAKKKLPLTLIVVLCVALGEAVAFFAVYKYMGGGPTPARAEGSPAAEVTPAAEAPAEGAQGGAHGAGKEPPAKEASAAKEGPSAEGGTKEGAGGEGKAASPDAVPTTGMAEVLVLKSFKVPNNKSGRMFIYDMDISVVVAAGEKDRVEKLVKERSAAVGDGVALLIRRASERTLGEDDLRTLRAQLKEVLVEVVNDDRLIQRVLIPRFVPIRAD